MENFAPLLIGSFPHADDVRPLNEDDLNCFQEIKQVLEKYDKLGRFGLTLLHKHFELADDEVLFEETDEINRIQVIKPVKVKDVATNHETTLETSWSLQKGDVLMKCEKKCGYTAGGHHKVHFATTDYPPIKN